MTMAAIKPVDEDGALQPALNALDDAIWALTDPQSHMLDGKHVYVPSRYLQLRDAVAGEQSNTGSGSGGKSRPPFWTDAFDQLLEIDNALEIWQPQPDGIPVTVGRLRALRARSWRPQDVARLEKLTKNIIEWVSSIDALFSEEPVRALWAAEGGGFAACPHCEKTMAKKLDRGGDLVQYPALQVMKDASTRCMACKHSWGPDLAMWVCRQLGYPLPPGVLE